MELYSLGVGAIHNQEVWSAVLQSTEDLSFQE